MRILFVTMQYGRSYLQGTERYISTITACLRERGHETAVLAGDPLRLDCRRQGAEAGGRASRPPELGELVDPVSNLFALPARGWMAVQGARPRRLIRCLEKLAPDVVHVTNPAHIGVGIVAACRQLNLPVVISTHDFWWVCPKATLLRADGAVCEGNRPWPECIRCLAGSARPGWLRPLARLPRMAGLLLGGCGAKALLRGMSPADLPRWMRRQAILSDVLTAADEVVFLSPATEEAIRPLVRHDRCRIIRCGLTPEWFEAPRPRPAGPLRPAELTIGYAGALLPHKGPHVLLEAVRLLGWKETRIVLAGPEEDPAYAARLRELAQGLRVEFAGPIPPARMPAFLRKLDVLAMTSVWPENLPLIVLEAQASGVPVAASRLAGVADQIGDDRLLFEPGSAKGLAAALEFVAGQPQAVRLGSVSTAEEMTAKTEAVYTAAVQRCRLPGRQGLRGEA